MGPKPAFWVWRVVMSWVCLGGQLFWGPSQPSLGGLQLLFCFFFDILKARNHVFQRSSSHLQFFMSTHSQIDTNACFSSICLPPPLWRPPMRWQKHAITYAAWFFASQAITCRVFVVIVGYVCADIYPRKLINLKSVTLPQGNSAFLTAQAQTRCLIIPRAFHVFMYQDARSHYS